MLCYGLGIYQNYGNFVYKEYASKILKSLKSL